MDNANRTPMPGILYPMNQFNITFIKNEIPLSAKKIPHNSALRYPNEKGGTH